MSTLTEIEAAAAGLSPDEKFQLVRFLIESVPPDEWPRPEPRDIPIEEINAWLEEDERAGRAFRARQAAKRSASKTT